MQEASCYLQGQNKVMERKGFTNISEFEAGCWRQHERERKCTFLVKRCMCKKEMVRLLWVENIMNSSYQSKKKDPPESYYVAVVVYNPTSHDLMDGIEGN